MSLTPFSFSSSHRVNRVSPPESEEWMRRDAEANAAAFYYHQQQSTDDYVLTDDEVINRDGQSLKYVEFNNYPFFSGLQNFV